ncbi:MAG: hypothetical protein M3Q56_04200 [Bacteroidota bacterium]|nr:hypothetical protein [Bacteroidota bacterium]
MIYRIWVASLVGSHWVLDKGFRAHSEQGPGVGTAYIIGIILAIVVLIIVTIFVKLRF